MLGNRGGRKKVKMLKHEDVREPESSGSANRDMFVTTSTVLRS
jgi:hypothetical protein